MIEEPPELTIRRPNRRPSASQIAAFKDVPTSFVADAIGGGGALHLSIQPLAPDALPGHAAGPALTADNSPSDLMATFTALAFLQAGDILVSAFAGYQGCAAAGDRVAGMAKNAGAVGFVTDGPVRDYAGLLDAGLPCWCTGLTPASPFGTGPGAVGLPIQIGGQRIETGDMIVADRDGVVVVPFAQLDTVIAQLVHVLENEKVLDAKVADGLVVPDVVHAWLNSDKVRFVD
jgi:4-hydroxy-4-methyl-2-oxoglutarate aldolase